MCPLQKQSTRKGTLPFLFTLDSSDCRTHSVGDTLWLYFPVELSTITMQAYPSPLLRIYVRALNATGYSPLSQFLLTPPAHHYHHQEYQVLHSSNHLGFPTYLSQAGPWLVLRLASALQMQAGSGILSASSLLGLCATPSVWMTQSPTPCVHFICCMYLLQTSPTNKKADIRKHTHLQKC
jgi:hypothetical protein